MIEQAPNPSAVEAALLAVCLPDGVALTASDRLSPIRAEDGRVSFSIAVAAFEAASFEPVRRDAEAAVRAVPGVTRVLVTLTEDRAAAAAGQPRRAARLPGPRPIPGISRIIAVASGKGGVGKSTTACNLAIALRAQGRRIGLLDADIYGPSQPRLFGLAGTPRLRGDRLLEPLEAYGVKVMSLGLLIEPEQAVVWRGPMVLSAITQMLREVAWGQLDLLLVDLPPGTGDAQLAIAEAAPLSGAVIVSTPQDLALIDVRRGIAMFAKVGVPILGLIENMAHFTCTTCGARHDLFGAHGARDEARRLGLPFLGEVPLALSLRVSSDVGRPVTALEPDSALGRAFAEIATALGAALATPTPATPTPATAAGRLPRRGDGM